MGIHISRLMNRLEEAGIRARVYNRASEGQDLPRAVSIMNRQKRWFIKFALFAPEKVLYIFTGRTFVRFLAWMLKVLRGKQYILRVGEERLLETLSSGSLLARWMTRVALRGARHVVAVSPHLAEAVLSAGVRPERVHVIPGFIPPDESELEPAQDVLDFAGAHSPVFSANGQLYYEAGDDGYGIYLLLDALHDIKASYPSAGLLLSLYGTHRDPPRLAAFQARIKELGLEDRVLLRTEPHLFWPILKRSDVFIRPTRTEGDSGSIREAIHLGVPVITSDSVPRPEPSVLFKDGDAEDCARKVRQVLEDLPAYRDRFRNAQVQDNARPIVDLLNECLGRGGSGR